MTVERPQRDRYYKWNTVLTPANSCLIFPGRIIQSPGQHAVDSSRFTWSFTSMFSLDRYGSQLLTSLMLNCFQQSQIIEKKQLLLGLINKFLNFMVLPLFVKQKIKYLIDAIRLYKKL